MTIAKKKERKRYNPPHVICNPKSPDFFFVMYNEIFEDMLNTKNFTKKRVDMAYVTFCHLQVCINNTQDSFKHKFGVTLNRGEAVFLTTYFSYNQKNIESYIDSFGIDDNRECKRKRTAQALKDLELFGLVYRLREEYTPVFNTNVGIYSIKGIREYVAQHDGRTSEMRHRETFIRELPELLGIPYEDVCNEGGTIDLDKLKSLIKTNYGKIKTGTDD